MHRPFSRFLSIMSAVQALIGSGMTQAAALAASGAANYKSRGKGKKSVAAKMHRSWNFGKRYPATSSKQHEKHAARQHTVIVNGFALMQTRSTRDRLVPLLQAAA